MPKAIKPSDFTYSDWINQFAGRWSILSFSYWWPVYNRKPFSPQFHRLVSKNVIIWREGKVWGYWRHGEKQQFGKDFNKVVASDPTFIGKLCREFKRQTRIFLAYTQKYYGKDITLAQYKKFHHLLNYEYYPYHMQVKVGADFLRPDLLEKYIHKLQEARLYAEPVFNRSEEFMRALAKLHSKKTGIAPELILCCLGEEFEAYLSGLAALPSKKVLADRYHAFALMAVGQRAVPVTGKKVDQIEKIVKVKTANSTLTGTMAYPGKVRGTVRVVFDPRMSKNFKKGDILVSGMTRPEFLSLMKLAAGIVTDSGGILCHAAIVAREMKKPCVIGTMTATKVLRDGDSVEVDAEKGIVTKL